MPSPAGAVAPRLAGPICVRRCNRDSGSDRERRACRARQRLKDACRKAGITNRSAHGLRKIAAARLAERGATEAELDAIFGWTGGRMASLYTRSANRRRLAIEAMHKLGTEQEKKRPPTEAALGHRAQPNNGVGQRAIDIRLAHGNFVRLAAVGTMHFQHCLPECAQPLHIRFNAGRCQMMGFGANEKKRGHNGAPWLEQAGARSVSQPPTPGVEPLPVMNEAYA
jgi:Phage integrase family